MTLHFIAKQVYLCICPKSIAGRILSLMGSCVTKVLSLRWNYKSNLRTNSSSGQQIQTNLGRTKLLLRNQATISKHRSLPRSVNLLNCGHKQYNTYVIMYLCCCYCNNIVITPHSVAYIFFTVPFNPMYNKIFFVVIFSYLENGWSQIDYFFFREKISQAALSLLFAFDVDYFWVV